MPTWRSSRIVDDPVRGGCGIRIRGDARACRRSTVGTSLRATTSAPGCGVEADDGATRAVGAEQRQLRLEVLAHVGVVVEVVVGEVGEAGDVEHDAVDATPAERLRAHLDGDRLDAALAHQGEEGVHLVRLGRRQPRHDDLSGDVPLGGGRQAGGRRPSWPRMPSSRCDDARLAVGAGRCRTGSGGRRRGRCCRPTPRARRAGRGGRRPATTGSPLAAATSAPAASVTTATAPFSAAASRRIPRRGG